MDERLRRDQHPLHRCVHAHPARHPGAEAKYPAAHGGGGGAWSFSMSEPDLGSDVAAIRRGPSRTGTGSRIDGAKMWLTNGGTSNLTAVLVRTDEGAPKAHQNLTCFLSRSPSATARSRRGWSCPGRSTRWATRAWTPPRWCSTGYHTSRQTDPRRQRGAGFAQMMDGVEVGRVNVAARACGISIRAFELAAEYAQQRRTFGKAIAGAPGRRVQAGGDGPRKVEACAPADGQRGPPERTRHPQRRRAGMAKAVGERVLRGGHQDSLRIHGGYGYSKEYESSG